MQQLEMPNVLYSTQFQRLVILTVIILVLFALVNPALSKPLHKMSNQDKTIELIFPKQSDQKVKINHAIIWLHGLGASSNDFPPVVPELGLSVNRPIRFIFPQAPDRPITINGGMSMPGWYDIKGMNIADKQDIVGMTESQTMLEALIQEQIDLGIPSTNIIIAGFSQGGAVVYHTGLLSKHKLAGLLTLSTYLPFADEFESNQSKVNLDTAIFANHGTLDHVVPIQLGKTSADKLKSLGYKIEWRTYPMEHQVIIQQIRDIGTWINNTFSN